MAVRRGWVFTTILLPVLVLLAPVLGLGLTGQRTIELILLLSLVVSGLNLCYGFAGELALGQIAVYAAGAYVAGYVSIHLTSDVLVGVALAGLAGPVIGLIAGIPGLRLGGWSLAMVSFFLVLMIPDIISILGTYTGGSAGLNGINHPALFGHVLGRQGIYLFVAGLSACWFAILRNFVMSRLGRSLLVLRESPVLAAAAKARRAYDNAVAAADAADRTANPPHQPRPERPTITAVEHSATGDSERRSARPGIHPGLPITSYTSAQLVAIIRWIESDTLLRTEDQLFEDFMNELGFRRRGSRIRTAFDQALPLARRTTP